MTGSTGFFRDRRDAGRLLGARLAEHRPGDGDVIVLGLPRGGVPVACEVARAIGAPVDVLIVRKLGAPFNPELAVGSVASGGVIVYNRWILEQLGLDESKLAPIVAREQREIDRRERVYREGRAVPEVSGKVAVIVDDGAATGATMQAAVEAARRLGAKRIVAALPSCSRDAADRLGRVADEVVVLSMPEPYMAVGRFYERFDQLSDEDVAKWLKGAEGEADTPSGAVSS